MSSSPNAPLSGLKILDFSSLLPGPYATMLLADMGAEVLRVEAPNRRDMVLDWPPFTEIDGEKVSLAHLQLHRNKQSIELDLSESVSVDVVKTLLTEYDVVIEQFRPGIMAKFGLDYASLKNEFPNLIYCSVSGYGQTGPMSQAAGHDINYLALSGISSYSGRKDTGPVLSGVQIADIAGGSHQAVISILASVFQRQNTGQGQHLDISMTDAVFSLNALFASGTAKTGHYPTPSGMPLNGGYIYGYYKTLDNRYLAVGALEPKFAMQLIQLLQLRVADPSNPDMSDLQLQIQAKIEQQELEHWTSFFADSDICVTPVLNLDEACASELLQQRQMLLQHQTGKDTVTQIAPPVKLRGVDTESFKTAPVSGAHTVEVLEKIGLSVTEIEAIMTHNSLLKNGS